LRRPHGPPRRQGVPREPGRGRGHRDHGPDRPPRRDWRRTVGVGSGAGVSDLILEGVSHVYGDNVDTDVIIPARYLTSTAPEELAEHCMEDLDPEFVSRVRAGDLMVAGRNFGSGASREHAPLAIKGAGVPRGVAEPRARLLS